MAREFHYFGGFEIHTDCSDVETIAKALNAMAATFGDAVKWEGHVGKTVMLVHNSLEMEIPIHEEVEDDEEVESA